MIRMTMELKGIKRLAAIFRPGLFEQTMRRHVKRATQQNAAFVAAAMRKTIQQGDSLKRNAALTIAIKGVDKPLVGLATDGLFQAITHKAVSEYEGFAGVLRTDDQYNIGVTVHEGVAIRVNDKMRGLFFYLWLASQGKISREELTGRAVELYDLMPDGWAPLADDADAIVIPERPFVEITINKKELIDRLYRNWHRSMGFVWRDMRRKFLTGNG